MTGIWRPNEIPGKPISVWMDTAPGMAIPQRELLKETDVLILGGGIVGLTTADHLSHSGKKIAMVEASQLVTGVTGFTTAKITSLHKLIYHQLIDRFGEEKAQQYADANQWAIEHIRETVATHSIDCDFFEEKALTYTMSPDKLWEIEKEVDAAKKLGLPASLEFPSGQNFPIAGAIQLTGQARFHPRKYLLDLAKRFIANGGTIVEGARALKVTEDAEGVEVETTQGVIRCKQLVLATHSPIHDEAFYFARLFPRRSYALAMRVNGALPCGMYINIDDTVRSMRRHRLAGEDILILGGEGHKPGQDDNTVDRYMALANWAMEHFNVLEFLYHWSTQDNQTPDGLPYIGFATKKNHRILLATGFDGWGMTNGTVAGKLLADLILETPNPWTELYDPNRGEVKGVPKMVKEGLNVAKYLLGDPLKGGERIALSGVLAGEGKIVETEDGLVAAYRDKCGGLHLVSPECTHMGCNLHWNTAEKSWDCPCHGSRFNPEGEVLHGPAVTPLTYVKLDEE